MKRYPLLIVDPDPRRREQFQRQLRLSFQAVALHSAEEALARFDAIQPVAVVATLRQNNGHGLELCLKLWERAAGARCFMLVHGLLRGNPSREGFQRRWQVDAFVPQRVDPEMLEPLLWDGLHRKQLIPLDASARRAVSFATLTPSGGAARNTGGSSGLTPATRAPSGLGGRPSAPPAAARLEGHLSPSGTLALPPRPPASGALSQPAGHPPGAAALALPPSPGFLQTATSRPQPTCGPRPGAPDLSSPGPLFALPPSPGNTSPGASQPQPISTRPAQPLHLRRSLLAQLRALLAREFYLIPPPRPVAPAERTVLELLNSRPTLETLRALVQHLVPRSPAPALLLSASRHPRQHPSEETP